MLRELAPSCTAKEIAAKIGTRSQKSVNNKARQLGIKPREVAHGLHTPIKRDFENGLTIEEVQKKYADQATPSELRKFISAAKAVVDAKLVRNTSKRIGEPQMSIMRPVRYKGDRWEIAPGHFTDGASLKLLKKAIRGI